jgi:hypothetical protein
MKHMSIGFRVGTLTIIWLELLKNLQGGGHGGRIN